MTGERDECSHRQCQGASLPSAYLVRSCVRTYRQGTGGNAMIAQILDYDFLSGRLRQVETLLTAISGGGPITDGLAKPLAARGVSVEQLRAALAVLHSEGRKDLGRPPRANESRQAFISSEQSLSLLQSALE